MNLLSDRGTMSDGAITSIEDFPSDLKNRNFARELIYSVDFSGKDLTGCNFNGAVLSRSDMMQEPERCYLSKNHFSRPLKCRFHRPRPSRSVCLDWRSLIR